MIHFLLDSTSAIPESYLEQHENVHVVPPDYFYQSGIYT